MAYPQLMQISLSEVSMPSKQTQQSQKKAKRTKSQVIAGKERTDLMWQDIHQVREQYRKSIADLVAQYSR